MAYTMAWGLFHWTASGVYKAEDCLKEYKTKGGAERASSKLYDEDRSSDIVARQYYKEV